MSDIKKDLSEHIKQLSQAKNPQEKSMAFTRLVLMLHKYKGVSK